MTWQPTKLPFEKDIESKQVLRKIAKAHRALAELKGIAQTIPNQDVLINTLTLQEAKDSSEVENIVTTHDELYKSTIGLDGYVSPAAKEVQDYVSALKRGFAIVIQNRVLTTNHILEIQELLEKNQAGLRKIPGTALKNQRTGEVVYEPPQNAKDIVDLMENLEHFINDNDLIDYDPIVKMAIIHHQFESIHPFYDGNGRTGRIINILYLVLNDLLHLPILYLSRYIIKNKGQYYALLQEVRETQEWENWLMYMTAAVEETAYQTIELIKDIKKAMAEMKTTLRDIQKYKFYSQELINHLFKQPYTKIEFVQRDLRVSRPTASAYLNTMADDGVIIKHKMGRNNYYINPALMKTLQRG